MIKPVIRSMIKPMINPVIVTESNDSSYASTVLADNPIMYIKGNTDDVGLDSSGNSYDMVENGVISSVSRSGFPEESVIDLSAMPDQPMKYTGNELNPVGDVTFEMWVEFTAIPTAGQWVGLFHYGLPGDETEPANTFYLYYYHSGDPTAFAYSHEYGLGTNEAPADIVYILSTGTVYHMVCVRDNTAKTIKIYLNGVLAGSTTYTNQPTGGTSASCITTIGNPSASGGKLGGYVSSFTVYHTKLSTDRITAHYNANGT